LKRAGSGRPSTCHRAANQLIAANLKGKLFLVHGELDDRVLPYGTLRLVDALVAANKDFDLLILPNVNHGGAMVPYSIRRKWDYFVRHLLGAEPPVGYAIQDPEPRF
jgi:dipeptidyl-peptidase 4